MREITELPTLLLIILHHFVRIIVTIIQPPLKMTLQEKIRINIFKVIVLQLRMNTKMLNILIKQLIITRILKEKNKSENKQ